MTLKELRQQRAQKASRGKAATTEYNILVAITERTAEQDAKLAALDAELEALEADVTALDEAIAKEEAASRRAGLFATGATSGAGGAGPTPARSAGRVFGEPTPGMGGFKSLSEMALAVRSAMTGGGADPRLADLNSPALGAAPTNFEQNSGTAGEGFLVPPDFRQQIWELVFSGNDLIDMVTPTPTNSNFISIPKDETTPWGATGVQAAWRAEAGALTASKISIGQTTMQLHELYAFVIATNELLDDAPRLNDKLTRQAARAINWQASEAIFRGDGNGKPLGFINSGALVTVAKESGQATLTLAVANILKMMSRLYRTGGGQAFWIANPDVLPQLGALTIGNNAAWLPLNQPMQGTPWEGTLCGLPIMFSEHAASLTNVGDISLVNLDAGYLWANKAGGGIDFASSIHLFFDYNMQAFRWTYRCGGQPYLSAPITPAQGSNTKSQFVTLQAR